MEKLSIKQARERENAHPGNIAACKGKIAATFPPSVSPGVLDRFLCDATQAVVEYRDLLPIGRPRSRQHRATAEQEYESGSTHRPADAHRHALIGELYDAWMSARGTEDPDAARGFKPTADAVLAAAGLSQVTRPELRYLRARIKDFARIAAPQD